MTQVQAPAFNKFNSLDRRALSKRATQSGSNLKLQLPYSSSGSESLPPTPSSQIVNPVQIPISGPERRHSSYDSASRSRLRNSNKNSDKLTAMNMNGLPESVGSSGNGKFHMNSGVYSSHESLNRFGSHHNPNQYQGLPRSGAGTPQFQNITAVKANSKTMPNTQNNFNRVNNGSSLIMVNSLLFLPNLLILKLNIVKTVYKL